MPVARHLLVASLSLFAAAAAALIAPGHPILFARSTVRRVYRGAPPAANKAARERPRAAAVMVPQQMDTTPP